MDTASKTTFKEIKEEKNPCAKLFIVALFAAVKNWKLRGCLSIREWIDKVFLGRYEGIMNEDI